MALTPEQIAARQGKLGASDVAALMNGNAQDIYRLWLEKTMQKEPDNLDRNFQVQLGAWTEPFNLNWYEQENKQNIIRRGETASHWKYDWAICTLDGWIEELQCPIECKHVRGREPFDPVLIERYQPQMQWQMEVTGAAQCCFSVIMATDDPIVKFIPRDPDYARELVTRGAQFIKHVRYKTEPVNLPAVPAPIDAKAIYDMQGNNEWANQAGIWIDLRDSAVAYDESAKILKSLVPADAKKAFGHGVQITRNSAGRLSLREMNE